MTKDQCIADIMKLADRGLMSPSQATAAVRHCYNRRGRARRS